MKGGEGVGDGGGGCTVLVQASVSTILFDDTGRVVGRCVVLWWCCVGRCGVGRYGVGRYGVGM